MVFIESHEFSDKAKERMRAAMAPYIPPPGEEELLSKRQYLVRKAILDGSDIWMAIEAVSSTAMEHPELDMEEERTWAEWESDDR